MQNASACTFTGFSKTKRKKECVYVRVCRGGLWVFIFVRGLGFWSCISGWLQMFMVGVQDLLSTAQMHLLATDFVGLNFSSRGNIE